jgi:hypothetical protein
MVGLVHPMAHNDTERETTARPVDEPAAILTSEQQSKQAGRAAPEAAVKPIAPVENSQDFKAGERDPLAGVRIKEVLVKTESYIVYIDEDLGLHWRGRQALDSSAAQPIFSQAGELQARSEFLRQTFHKRNLLSARRLIGEGLGVMFSTRDPAYAKAALDTAEKFITQRGRETSRGWYFGPFFVFFAVSVLAGFVLYRHGHMRITTLPLVCSLGGGIGAFISSAIGHDRIPCAPSAGWILHFLEALLRYTIGFVAGLLVWLAASGNIAIGFLNLANGPSTSPWPGGHLPTSSYALVVVAILAGASERLLPSLISKFDGSKGTGGAQTTETETSKPPGNPS